MEHHSLVRVDKLLQGRYPTLTSRQIEEALTHHLITGDRGQWLKKGSRVEPDFTLDTQRLDHHMANLHSQADVPITIVAEEPNWFVIDKPAGIHSHPISLFDRNTVSNWFLKNYPQIRNEFSQVQPAISPHRLDRDTSGLLIVAKAQAGYNHWRALFSEKKVTKNYLAWCWGSPSQDLFTVDAPIGHTPGQRGRMTLSEEGTPAVSQVTVVQKESDHFLCEVEIRTGVTHQIRVHLSSQGFPILGDSLYDKNFVRRRSQPTHQLLRAYSLRANAHNYSLPREFPKA
ncbi:MAG: RluA family pseudouridine synthase [Deltaproteobacteria bacterium]|nr:RluA family pseudouridine synthase [Deltaproteobacteria bacterium]MBI3296083.1 RluA family pseudouridine synthase [Deltaproteobacteria bacterium]